MRVQNITDMIGNTPLLKIDDNIEYYAKQKAVICLAVLKIGQQDT